MNRYFLLIACLQLYRDITPVNPLTTWLPLAVIFGVTAVKEGIDDYGRYKADKAANSRVYTVIREGKEEQVASAEIRVGDLLKLEENDEVPCDAVLLACSDPAGNAYIQTTNLDGESNLKVRNALPATKGLRTPAQFGTFKGTVECSAPNEHIYSFDSQLRVVAGEGPVLPLSSSQLLLQATHVRNTEWAVGLVVYTGNETKFGKNKKTPPTKYTKADGFINTISVSIFIFQLFLVLVFGLVGDDFTRRITKDDWYFRWGSNEFSGVTIIVIPARFLLLNSTMIPISLKLTMDLCKLFYSKFIDADIELYDAENDIPAHANSTALAEDLGQVRYVLTDKTGTLTENRMVLKAAVVGPAFYGASPLGADKPTTMSLTVEQAKAVGPMLGVAAQTGILADSNLYNLVATISQSTENVRAREFVRCLALNNDVVPGEHKAGHTAHGVGSMLFPRVYKASSPDEEALVKAASVYGASLWAREGDQVTIRVGGGAPADAPAETYTQLAAFEFTSDRKRMSVLLRMPNGSTRLYVKGADDMIMARLSHDPALNPPALVKQIQASIDGYAEQGLRTLVYGYRDVPASEYEAWKVQYDEAAAAMKDREAAKERVYAQMEREVVLLGASAIEDKLQDGVPETLRLLKQAGVSFWMLTGDKFSTALTIAGTAALKPKSNLLITIEGDDLASTKASVQEAYDQLASQGHDLRYEAVPSWTQDVQDVLTGKYWSRLPPPQPFTSQDVEQPLSEVQVVDSGKGEDSVSSETIGVALPPQSGRGRAPGPCAGGRVPFTVIIRGSTIEHCLNDPALRVKFASVACAADSLIACRVTPKQKGQMVKLVKEAGHLTLAIGDGGNDVAMIQEASVGVGIVGKEGLQASRASDYAVPFFRALQRLLLVHGRNSYTRTAYVAQYSFYKSLLFCFLQIGFGFFSGFAGVSMFNSLCVAAYNAVLFVPIVFFLVDKDISIKTALTLPTAYLPCSNGDYMNFSTMGSWAFRALWQSIIVLLFSLYGNSLTRSADYESLGLLVFMAYMWGQDFTMVRTPACHTLSPVRSCTSSHLSPPPIVPSHAVVRPSPRHSVQRGLRLWHAPGRLRGGHHHE